MPLDLYRGSFVCNIPLEEYKKEIKKIAIVNIYQTFKDLGLEFFDYYKNIFTKEEQIDILWDLYSIEEEVKIIPYMDEYVDEVPLYGCWVENPEEITIGAWDTYYKDR